MEVLLEVLNWVLIIFIAGFIGYFGKALSKKIISYFRKKKGVSFSKKVSSSSNFSTNSKDKPQKYKYKLEKKKLKKKG